MRYILASEVLVESATLINKNRIRLWTTLNAILCSIQTMATQSPHSSLCRAFNGTPVVGYRARNHRSCNQLRTVWWILINPTKGSRWIRISSAMANKSQQAVWRICWTVISVMYFLWIMRYATYFFFDIFAGGLASIESHIAEWLLASHHICAHQQIEVEHAVPVFGLVIHPSAVIQVADFSQTFDTPQ